MVPFAGYNMPVEYSGITEEHIRVREGVGVFDVSHMGEFWVTGPEALKFLQYITSNDVESLFDGKIQYSCFPNGKGGIVDDLLIYRYDQEKYLLVVNAANIDKDWNWCVRNAEKFGLIPGKDLINASDSYAQLAIQGPLALKAMQKLTDTPVGDMEYSQQQVILEQVDVRSTSRMSKARNYGSQFLKQERSLISNLWALVPGIH